MFQSNPPTLITLNQILQKTLDYLVFQSDKPLNLDDYALTPLLATQPQYQTDQAIQVTIPLLRNRKIQWTLTLEQATEFLSIRIATGARINHCQLVLTIKNMFQIQIDGKELVDNSWVNCKLTKTLEKGQYCCEIDSPDADNQNNVLFLWLTIKNDLNAKNIILSQHDGLEPIINMQQYHHKPIKKQHPLLHSTIIQWTWHQSHHQPIKQLYCKLGTGGRKNTCELSLKVFTLDWQLITESKINAQHVIDGEWTIFPLQTALPENTTCILQLSSSDATVDNAIFVYFQVVGMRNYQFTPVTEYKKRLENDKIALFLFVPTFIYNIAYLKTCLQQIAEQTINDWQLFILIEENNQHLDLIQTYQQQYPQQINVIFNQSITHYFKNIFSNLTAKYCAFLNPNHILEKNALEIILYQFDTGPEVQLISTDYDVLTCDGNGLQPCFQSASPDRETLYFYRSEILQPPQSHDFSIWQYVVQYLKNWVQNYQIHYFPLILQTIYQNLIQQQLNLFDLQSLQQREIQHITKILYHQYPAYPLQNLSKTQNQFFNPTVKVSIIIPNKDLSQYLKRCINSIIHHTRYPNWEIIVVDNNSQQAETFELYQYYQQKLAGQFKQINCNIPFNFSKLVNIGVKQATGDIILLLNNDTEILKSQNWLEKMLWFTQQKNMACVGCKLVYPQDHTIQHAGIICGIGGIANHGHRYYPMYSQGYCNRLTYPSFYTAITGACLMVSKKLWQRVEGFDEKLAVAFNDVDFCLKLQQLAYRHIVVPDVYIYHHESKSRGLETTPQQQKRLAQETQIMRQRWGDLLDNDLCYSPHLTKKAEDFSLSEDSIYYATIPH